MKLFLKLSLATLSFFSVLSSSQASAVQGQLNPHCPSFAPYGYPTPTDTRVLSRSWHVCHQAYSSYVDPLLKVPLWSVEKLEGSGLSSEESRTNDFRPDPDIPSTAQARSQRDYARSGYDQGHLSPAADFRGFSSSVMSESFYYSNIVPQNADNNRHAWQKLEIFTRQWAQDRQVVYVYTGPVFMNGRTLGTLGTSQLAIPTHLFKVIIDFQRMEALTFVLPNQAISPVDSSHGSATFKQWAQTLAQYQTTIQDLEQMTGMTFNPTLPSTQRQKLHSILMPMWKSSSHRKSS